MIYEVFIVAAAKRRIREQAEYIATVQGAPETAARTAARWLTRIYDKIDGLAEMPRRSFWSLRGGEAPSVLFSS